MTKRKTGISPRVAWTSASRDWLAQLFAAQMSDAHIAAVLGGTVAAIRVQRLKMGLTREDNSPIAAIRSARLRALREAEAAAQAAGAPDDDDDDDDDGEGVSARRQRQACVAHGLRIEASGRRYEDVRLRRAG